MHNSRDRIAHIQAEAAAWFARLDSDECRPADKADFQRWLAEDENHGMIFNRMASSWQEAGPAAEELAAENATPPRSHVTRRHWLMAAAASIAALAGGAAWWHLHAPDVYETAVGEQRRIVLADRSEILLDTNSRISVKLGKADRRLILERGRANFAVAHDSRRPFQVTANNQIVTALGTEFDVTVHSHGADVFVLSGQVAVDDDNRPVLLTPGERLTVTATASRIDHPQIGQITAWQQGRLIFAQTPLSEAAAQFNRYAALPIRITDPGVGQLRISGVYSVRDIDGFTDALPRTLQVKVTRSAEAITVAAP